MTGQWVKSVGVVAVTGLLIVLVAGCVTRVSEPPRPPSESAGIAGYLLLADGSIHARSDGPPAGFHVRGMVVGERFAATGDVLGEGALRVEGQPGWLELSDGSFHGDQTGRAPFPPYVHGVMGDDGVFRPDSRIVVY